MSGPYEPLGDVGRLPGGPASWHGTKLCQKALAASPVRSSVVLSHSVVPTKTTPVFPFAFPSSAGTDPGLS